jgi:hypothetical protein
MQTDRWQWFLLLITALSGGAMGALITAFIGYRRNKRQPIAQKIEFFPVLYRTPNFPSLRAILMDETDSGSGPGVAVENLYLARITISNEGNQDIPEFRFGATLTGNDEGINVITESPDRHHSMVLVTPVSLAHPRKELDFKVTPFNRKEPYIANIYFRTKEIHSEIKLSSPHSSKFVERREIPRVVETLANPLMMALFGVTLVVFAASSLQLRQNDRLIRELREQSRELAVQYANANTQGNGSKVYPNVEVFSQGDPTGDGVSWVPHFMPDYLMKLDPGIKPTIIRYTSETGKCNCPDGFQFFSCSPAEKAVCKIEAHVCTQFCVPQK